MSTEPGNSKGGSGRGGAGRPGGRPAATGKAADKPGGKTVAAASAKPARDEATVEIDSDAASENGASTTAGSSGSPGSTGSSGPSSGAGETRIDLAQVKDEAEKADAPEIAPVKDTAAEQPPKGPASGKRPGPANWAKPAEPSGSVSTGRTEKPPAPSAAAASGGASGNSSGSGRPGSGFAGTVLKDRPSAAVAPVNSSRTPAQTKPARKAQLQLARLEPWSVMKFSFVMSLVCFVVLLVAVVVLYMILSGLGVFDAISDTINSLTKQQGETDGGVDAGNWFSFARVFGYTVIVGALNVLLITALSTVGSVIYNLAADLVGGVEVTLKEAE
ncbi:DUF3566 domain-containing protein [Actinomadura opuntiae]|uniref:DUF3566 domain-containing protein n=1 Tax=Actinomadura sp. OS1-43 TaxID=604315 RepID=UPI00255AF77D|nr:DUF3566 domain-containing protein [Actinomadura sp. OS1-43]MDL4816733.1 DUF3566 domain-containing protein [Actinomadura sp. OS1-43]